MINVNNKYIYIDIFFPFYTVLSESLFEEIFKIVKTLIKVTGMDIPLYFFFILKALTSAVLSFTEILTCFVGNQTLLES